MLATNLIPNELRYQLEFEDLPARTTPLSEEDLTLILGGVNKVKVCKPGLSNACKGGAECVPKKAIYNVKFGSTKYQLRKGKFGAKRPSTDKLGVYVCKPS